MPPSESWPAIADLVPHTGLARLLTAVVRASPTEIQAVGEIPARHPLAASNRAPALLAIELGAQAAAAMEAIGRLTRSDGTAAPRTGSLVRIREAQIVHTSLPVETPIDVIAELVGSAPPLAIYRIQATLHGTVVVHAVISTHAGAIGGES